MKRNERAGRRKGARDGADSECSRAGESTLDVCERKSSPAPAKQVTACVTSSYHTTDPNTSRAWREKHIDFMKELDENSFRVV